MVKQKRIASESVPSSVSSDDFAQLIVAHLEKKFGRGAATTLENTAAYEQVDIIPTGSLSLDLALGIGGFPRGKVVEAYGTESSGKTTLILKTIANAQKMGLHGLYIDLEHSFNPLWATKCGIDLSKLTMVQPDSGEDAIDKVMETLDFAKERCGIIGFDSVDALTPRAEINGDSGDSVIGLRARLVAQFMRKVVPVISHTNTLLLLSNQLRDSIGAFSPAKVTPGGRAIKYYASVRVELARTGKLGSSPNFIGSTHKANVVKSKVSAPYRLAEFEVYFEEGGISVESEILDIGSSLDIIEKKGAYYYYNGEVIGYGREVARKNLRENNELAEELYDKIIASTRNDTQISISEEPEEEEEEYDV